jgi:dCMP deaminase
MSVIPPLNINPDRIELDEAYLQMAEIWAKRSKANRKQVGAIVVKNDQIISDGYNGLPSGEHDDVCEHIDPMDLHASSWLDPISAEIRWPYVWIDPATRKEYRYALVTKKEVLHAESNALLKISRNGGIGASGATLYVTMSPCEDCAKLIRQAQIKKVVFREAYRDLAGVRFLEKRGVDVVHLPHRK